MTASNTPLNQTYKQWPVHRRLVIDYFAEDAPQAQAFEDATVSHVRGATVVAVDRIRVVHHEHIRSFAVRRMPATDHNRADTGGIHPAGCECGHCWPEFAPLKAVRDISDKAVQS